MRVLFLAALCALNVGCAVKSYAITVLEETPNNSGHYVLIRSATARDGGDKSMKVYDCVSVVEGQYDPTCTRVRVKGPQNPDGTPAQ